MSTTGKYQHTTAIVFTLTTDLIQHRDMARDARLVPIAGGFCNRVTEKEVRCYGESLSCNVSTFPRATMDIDKLWADATIFEKEYYDEYNRKTTHLLFLAIKNGLEPTDKDWIPITVETFLKKI